MTLDELMEEWWPIQRTRFSKHVDLDRSGRFAERRALELEPTDEHTVEGALERLVPWFEKLGRADEARRIVANARLQLGS